MLFGYWLIVTYSVGASVYLMCSVRHYVRSVQSGQVWGRTKAKCHIWHGGDRRQLLLSEQFSTRCTRLPPAGCWDSMYYWNGSTADLTSSPHPELEERKFHFFLTQWKEDAQRGFSFPQWNLSHMTQTLSVTSFLCPHTAAGDTMFLTVLSHSCGNLEATTWNFGSLRSKVRLGNLFNKHLGIFQEFTY